MKPFLPRTCSEIREFKKMKGAILIKKKVCFFDVFLTVDHSIDFSKYQLSAQFF